MPKRKRQTVEELQKMPKTRSTRRSNAAEPKSISAPMGLFNLPLEIRLMIYDYFPPRQLIPRQGYNHHPRRAIKVRDLTNLMRTCKAVYEELRPSIYRHIQISGLWYHADFFKQIAGENFRLITHLTLVLGVHEATPWYDQGATKMFKLLASAMRRGSSLSVLMLCSKLPKSNIHPTDAIFTRCLFDNHAIMNAIKMIRGLTSFVVDMSSAKHQGQVWNSPRVEKLLEDIRRTITQPAEEALPPRRVARGPKLYDDDCIVRRL